MNNLFATDKINLGRQKELDMAKAFSIIFMVFVHVFLIALYFNNSFSKGYKLIFDDILGGPAAAPIFMFCMGVGVVYSRHSQWNVMIKRGIMLMLLGIFVNFFEYILPWFYSGILLGNWNTFDIFGGLIIFEVDILAFAGLSFIMMGIFKKINLSNKQLLIFAIILSILGSFLNFIEFHNVVLDILFGYFIGTNVAFTAFPFFNWFIFPISGLIWGQYFIRVKDKERFFKFWPILIIVSLIYIILYSQFVVFDITTSSNIDGFYYYMDIIDVIFCLVFAHGMIGLCYKLSKHSSEKITKAYSILSSNITLIYLAQWFFIPLIIIFLVYLFKNIVFTDLLCTIISIVVLILSTAFSIYYKKLKIKLKN